MKIVKLENSRIIEIRTDGGVAYQSFSSCISGAEVKCLDKVVQVVVDGKFINIPASEVTSTQVQPAAEVPFSGDAFDLLALLNASFFDSCCDLSGTGGSALNSAANGLYVSGLSQVRLGMNPLIENTTITEDGFDHTHTRTEDPAGNGNVTTTYESFVGLPISTVAGVSLLRRLNVTDSNDNEGEFVIGADNDNSAFAYMRSRSSNVEARAIAQSNIILLENLTGGVSDGFVLLSGGVLNANVKDGSVIIVNGNFFQSQEALFEAFGSPPKTQRQTIEIDYTANVNGLQDVYEIPLQPNEKCFLKFEGSYEVIGLVTGSANYQVLGGGSRIAANAAEVTADTESVRETFVGAAAQFAIVPVGNSIFLQINRNRAAENVRFIGLLTIIKTVFV